MSPQLRSSDLPSESAFAGASKEHVFAHVPPIGASGMRISPMRAIQFDYYPRLRYCLCATSRRRPWISGICASKISNGCWWSCWKSRPWHPARHRAGFIFGSIWRSRKRARRSRGLGRRPSIDAFRSIIRPARDRAYRWNGSPREATPLSFSRRRSAEMMPSTRMVTR